jgi:hypothetical protein
MNMSDVDYVAIVGLDSDAPTTVAELDRLLMALRAELQAVEALHDAIASRITEPHWQDTREVERARHDAQHDLALLMRGVGLEAGVSDHRLVERINRPGLSRLRELEGKLTALRDQLSDPQPWPREFRYTGRPGRTRIGGRHLEPGDVVALSRQQARAFGDRFAPVDEVRA